MEINERIRKRRKLLGLTLKQVADKMGVSESLISRYESKDVKNMGIDKLIPLAEVLGVTPSYLMGWEENPAYELLISMGHSEEDLNETLIQSNVTFGDSLHVKAKLSKVESQLIEDYRALDDYGKETVDIALERELKRCQAMDIKLNAAHELPNATEDGKVRDNKKIDRLLRDKK